MNPSAEILIEEELITSIATYTNSALKETYELGGIRDLPHAWRLADFVSRRNIWNKMDISKVTLTKRASQST